MNRFTYNAATLVTKYLLLPIYTRITVTGLENLPMSGPLIIASNHLNDTDPGTCAMRARVSARSVLVPMIVTAASAVVTGFSRNVASN